MSDSDDDVPLYLRKEKLRTESQAAAQLHRQTNVDIDCFATVDRDTITRQPKKKKTRGKTARKRHPAAVTACMERLIKELEKPEKAERLRSQKAAKAERDAIKAENARLRECGKVCAQLVKDVVLSLPQVFPK